MSNIQETPEISKENIEKTESLESFNTMNEALILLEKEIINNANENLNKIKKKRNEELEKVCKPIYILFDKNDDSFFLTKDLDKIIEKTNKNTVSARYYYDINYGEKIIIN